MYSLIRVEKVCNFHVSAVVRVIVLLFEYKNSLNLPSISVELFIVFNILYLK